jgi:hypothetical protein
MMLRWVEGPTIDSLSSTLRFGSVSASPSVSRRWLPQIIINSTVILGSCWFMSESIVAPDRNNETARFVSEKRPPLFIAGVQKCMSVLLVVVTHVLFLLAFLVSNVTRRNASFALIRSLHINSFINDD